MYFQKNHERILKGAKKPISCISRLYEELHNTALLGLIQNVSLHTTRGRYSNGVISCYTELSSGWMSSCVCFLFSRILLSSSVKEW